MRNKITGYAGLPIPLALKKALSSGYHVSFLDGNSQEIKQSVPGRLYFLLVDGVIVEVFTQD